MDRLAPTRNASRPAARQRPRPDAENFGGEVSQYPSLVAGLRDARSCKTSLDRVGPGLRDLGVVLCIHTRHADAADDLAVDHDWDAAFDQHHPAHGEVFQSYTAARHRVFDRLGRRATLDRGSGLAFGNPDRGKMRTV